MTIKEELEMLRRDNGLLVVEDVWNWARDNPASAIHAAIEWDTDKAAREFQFEQIRRLVRLNIVNEAGQPQVVSLTVDRVKPGGGYRRIDDVVADVELKRAMLNDALRDLRHWQAKYRHLKATAEFAPVHDAIDRAVATVEQPMAAVG